MSEYSFKKFTEDSSDDYPKYSDGIDSEGTPHEDNLRGKQLHIPQSADDWYYRNAYDELSTVPKRVPDDMYEDILVATVNKNDKFKIALSNVLELAKDGLQANFGQAYGTVSADEIIARDSVKFIEDSLH